MYLDHFGLLANPFSLSPKTDFVFRSGTFDENMAHLIYGLDNSEAVILITGPIGSGKTLAIQSFLSHLGPQYVSALVTNTQVGSLELLKLILDDLGIEFSSGSDKSDLLIFFKNYLLKEHNKGRRVVIVIDEAQNLAPDALEEIRLLTNIGQGDSQPVQIILVGQPELEERIDGPSLVQLRQRIRVHYRLVPLQPTEIEGYLKRRMEVAGCAVQVFKPKAVARIFELSGGIPRLVNTLASAALLSAFVDDRKVVEEKDIDPDDAGLPKVGPRKAPEYSMPYEKMDLPSPDVIETNEPEFEQGNPQVTPPSPYVHEEPEKRDRKNNKSVWALLAAAVFLIPLVLFLTGNLDKFIGKTKPDHQKTVVMETITEPGSEAILPESEENIVVSTEQAEQVEDSTIDQSGENSIFLHVASFLEQEDADNYASKLEKEYFPSRVEHHLVSNKNWYRVYLGPFESEESANAEVEKLKAEEGLKYFKVVKMAEVIG